MREKLVPTTTILMGPSCCVEESADTVGLHQLSPGPQQSRSKLPTIQLPEVALEHVATLERAKEIRVNYEGRSAGCAACCS